MELPATAPAKNVGDYRAVSDPAELTALVNRAIKAGTVAFDCETTGLNTIVDRLVGFSLSLETGAGVYVPIKGPEPELGVEPHPLMDEKVAITQITRLFATPGLTIALHNGKFDLEVLSRAGAFDTLPRKRPVANLFDTMIAAWLLDPDWTGLGLESLALSQLGLETISYATVVPKGKTFADVPIPEADDAIGVFHGHMDLMEIDQAGDSHLGADVAQVIHDDLGGGGIQRVITSYSIHYTKLYEISCGRGYCRARRPS